MSADGQSIAYEPTGKAFIMWKKYRGGQTARIWLARLSDSSITKVPRTNSNDFSPMWAGDHVYFLSDRNGPVTLFSYDIKTKAVKEAIPNQGLDFKSATLGPDAIVYEQFGGISLYDLKTGKTKPVAIRVQGDLPALRTKLVDVGKTPDVAGHLAQRRTRRIHGSRRHHHGARRQGRCPQSHQHHRRDGAGPTVGAGRQEHRLPLR